MRTPHLIIVAIAVLPVTGCAVVDVYKTALLPNDDSKMIAACLDQGTYMDTATHKCAPLPPRPTPTPQQQAAQAEFDAQVAAKAAQCTTGSKEMCKMWAAQQVIALKDFCLGHYKQAAYIIPSYKSLGWPVEMTAQQMAENSEVPLDLLMPLIKAGYSGRWKLSSDFAEEAARRCLKEQPF